MSDIEKNEVNPADSEEKDTTELEKELEDIKDLFQKELDKANDGSQQENEDELIQQLDEIEEETDDNENAEDLPLCECCGENALSTKHGEDYPYCDECRDIMVKYPIRFSGVAAVLLSVLLFFAGFYFCGNEILDSTAVLEAGFAYAENRMTTAATAYQQYFSGGAASEHVSRRAVREAVKAYMAFGATNDAVALIEEYYTEEELQKFSNREINEIYNFCTAINKTTEAVYEPMVYPALYGYISAEEAIASIREFITQVEESKAVVSTPTDAQKELREYDTAVAEYYIYYLMNTDKFDNDDRLAQIKKVAETGGEAYRWMYAPAMAMIAAEIGDFDALNEAREYIIKNNIEDVSAYITLAHYYFKQENIDAEKMLEACEQADEVVDSEKEMSHYRYYAAALLLTGDAKTAFSKMESYTAQGIQYVSDANLFALCALATDNTEVYEEMVSTLEGAGFEISDYVEKYKAGKITLEEALKNGGGDFI